MAAWWGQVWRWRSNPCSLKIGLIEAFNFGVAEQPSYDDRSIALSYGSSRIYQGMGLWDKLRSGVESIQHIHISDRGHFGATRMEAAEENVPALGYVVESRVLGKLLYEELDTGEVELIVPAKVFGVEQDADSVQVNIERNGVVDTLQTRLLVVSDGRDSGVRDMLGIGVTRREYHQTAIIANVTTAEPHRNLAYERFTPNGPLALLPLTEGRYSLVWTHRDADVAARCNWMMPLSCANCRLNLAIGRVNLPKLGNVLLTRWCCRRRLRKWQGGRW